ncbi:MAG: glycerate kinase [Acidobacteriota bacterium]|nr:glycerate kinase [Acidobacteriota bacterium]
MDWLTRRRHVAEPHTGERVLVTTRQPYGPIRSAQWYLELMSLDPSCARRVLVVPDKFRGTATAQIAGAALAAGAREAQWSVDECLVADGGEGFLDVFGGANRHTEIVDPLGQRRRVGWRRDGASAIIESALASGAQLVKSASPADAIRADSYGVGELIGTALDDGATTIIVGVGGLASTDGGRGALRALAGRVPFAEGVDVVVAVDVAVPFLDAAMVFARQKGADDDAVTTLLARLRNDAAEFRNVTGRDVLTSLDAGAGGGLAGGLWAAGARVTSGFALVARHQQLAERIARADLVLSGEGRLDVTSLSGKVTGSLVALTRELSTPLVLVAGDVTPEVARQLTDVATWNLTALFGESAARRDVTHCLREIARRVCRDWTRQPN